jgi:hypothetical protein
VGLRTIYKREFISLLFFFFDMISLLLLVCQVFSLKEKDKRALDCLDKEYKPDEGYLMYNEKSILDPVT